MFTESLPTIFSVLCANYILCMVYVLSLLVIISLPLYRTCWCHISLYYNDTLEIRRHRWADNVAWTIQK